MTIERALLVCYGDWMGLMMGCMIIENKGFGINSSMNNHPPTA